MLWNYFEILALLLSPFRGLPSMALLVTLIRYRVFEALGHKTPPCALQPQPNMGQKSKDRRCSLCPPCLALGVTRRSKGPLVGSCAIQQVHNSQKLGKGRVHFSDLAACCAEEQLKADGVISGQSYAWCPESAWRVVLGPEARVLETGWAAASRELSSSC